MIIFIIYLLILTQALNASFEPTSIEKFIKPAINLKEKQEETPFIGFEGSPGKYKKAQMYIINEKGKLQEKENFSFNLSPTELNTFFSAHTGSFTEPKKEEIAILVSNPITGTKIYLWEITESGEFKRIYKEPTTINPKNPSSQPIESIITNKNKKQNNITLSFGSPNRNIVVLDFEKDKINILWMKDNRRPKEPIPRDFAKLLTNVIVLAAECLPRGGVVSLKNLENERPNSLVMQLEGPQCNLRDDVKSGLNPEVSVEELTVRNVFAYFIASFALSLDRSLEIENISSDKIQISII